MDSIQGLKLFELEAYWGTSDGTLMHGTITVSASDVFDAVNHAFQFRLIPESRDDWFSACARPEYFCDHYDVEIVD